MHKIPYSFNHDHHHTTPQTKEKIAKEFLADLKSLLEKYDAEIEIYDDKVFDIVVNNNRFNGNNPYVNFDMKGRYLDKNCIDNIGKIFYSFL